MLYTKREWKLSHAGANVFDYNSALELDYLRFRKLNTVQEDDDEAHDRESLCSRKTASSEEIEKLRSIRDACRVSSLRDISMDTIASRVNLPALIQSVLPSVLTTSTPHKSATKMPIKRTLSGQPIKFSLDPLRTNQYTSPTRQTLILEGKPGSRECTVTDSKNGEVKFSCIPRQDGLVCRSYKSMLDIITVSKEGDVVGIFRSRDGFKDGLVARIRKGSFGKLKYQIDLITQAERTKIITSIAREPVRRTAFVNSAGPDVIHSLIVNKKTDTFRIRDKLSKFPVATLRKDANSRKEDKYWLHLEPNVDSSFASLTAVFALRKKLFGDNLPGILRSHHVLFSNGEKKVTPV